MKRRLQMTRGALCAPFHDGEYTPQPLGTGRIDLDWDRVAAIIKLLLHASRDCLRNLGKHDTSKIRFDTMDGYYGEAFGVLRGLEVLGYGYFGPCNMSGKDEGAPDDRCAFSWWFAELGNEVLAEEGYQSGTHRCEYCLKKWGKDTRSILDKLSSLS